MTQARVGYVRCSRDDDYLRSLDRAGVSVHAVTAAEGDPGALLRVVDGVVLPGGLDVDPARYHETLHPACALAGDARDEFEIEVARRCLRDGIPLLAICRGMQVLNVAAGGSLIQDIASQVPVAQPHTMDETLTTLAHDLEVMPGSHLARAVDAGMATRVNSRHHQALKAIGEGLQVTAYATDGMVEGVEAPGATFCVGVQWHPENFWETDEFTPLFALFAQACVHARRIGRDVSPRRPSPRQPARR